jgi:uroporphyrinogen-III synthase
VSGLPLAGKTIVVTRARQQASRLRRELEALGARVIELPTIEIVPPDSYAPLDAALRNLQQYQWLIVTSANTVRVLRERATAMGLTVDAFASVRCAAVGSATVEALREFGVRVDLVPEKYVAESLVAAMRDCVSGSRILLTRAAVARDVIPYELRRLGALVDVADAYRTVVPEESAVLMREVFCPPHTSHPSEQGARFPDAVTFTSSSTVANFFRSLQEAGLHRVPDGVQAISIGPIASATLREFGWEPSAEADPHDVAGLVAAVLWFFAGDGPTLVKPLTIKINAK